MKKRDKMNIIIGISAGLGLIGAIVLLMKSKRGFLPGFKNYFGSSIFLLGYPRGIRNNNPGNIELTSQLWKGEIPHSHNTDKRFKQFFDYTFGVRAAIINLLSYYKNGYRTIRQIITRWAPPGENNTERYIKNVVKYTGIAENIPVKNDKQTIEKLVKAIIIQENGRLYMTDDDFNKAWSLV